ncbi:MAG: zinc-dependent peptidase [bacterium]
MMFKKYRRKRILKKPFPDPWLDIIRKNVPLYQKLPEKLQQELLDDVKIFMAEKNFEGCGGLVLNDEIKVTIAAQACVLLLNRKTDLYSKLSTILVYPHGYIAPNQYSKNLGVITLGSQARLGESWIKGTVVLAWDHVLKGAKHLDDGSNLIFHEFAHQLDSEDNVADGTPVITDRKSYSAWVKVMSEDFNKLIHELEMHKHDILGDYAATNPAEFFAVATELFFEKPNQLSKIHPKMYEQLRNYYQQDPRKYCKNKV